MLHFHAHRKPVHVCVYMYACIAPISSLNTSVILLSLSLSLSLLSFCLSFVFLSLSLSLSVSLSLSLACWLARSHALIYDAHSNAHNHTKDVSLTTPQPHTKDVSPSP